MMNPNAYVVPQSTVFRRVGEELVVVQLETSRFYFFNPETEGFLDAFRFPRSLASYCEASGEKADPAYLKQFCQTLIEKKLMQETQATELTPQLAVNAPSKPEFLREADWTLDQLSFTCIP